MQAALVATDQFSNLLAAGAESTSRDGLIDEDLQSFGKRDVHCALS
jgi:hypothetical protein